MKRARKSSQQNNLFLYNSYFIAIFPLKLFVQKFVHAQSESLVADDGVYLLELIHHIVVCGVQNILHITVFILFTHHHHLSLSIYIHFFNGSYYSNTHRNLCWFFFFSLFFLFLYFSVAIAIFLLLTYSCRPSIQSRRRSIAGIKRLYSNFAMCYTDIC